MFKLHTALVHGYIEYSISHILKTIQKINEVPILSEYGLHQNTYQRVEFFVAIEKK